MIDRARGRRRVLDDVGSVTAEFAVTIPAVILLLVCCLSGLQVAGQQLRLQDAASAAARSLARGDSAAATAAKFWPGVNVFERGDGDLECITLTARSTAAVSTLVGFTLSASACALGGGR